MTKRAFDKIKAGLEDEIAEGRALPPIRAEQDYEAALAAIRPYFDREPAPGSPEQVHFDLLAGAIEEYENARFPIGEP